MGVFLACCLSCEHSAAEVHVSGSPDRVVLRANDATIADILAALRSAFDLEVTLKGTTTRKFTGVYSGSLRQMLSRLLMGEDYVLRAAPNGIGIRLVGRSAADSAAAPSSLPSASQGSRLVALRQGRLKRQGE